MRGSPAFAAATGIEADVLLRTAVLEYMPETWKDFAQNQSKTAVGTGRAFPEAQINIRGPAQAIERFEQFCGEDRRADSIIERW